MSALHTPITQAHLNHAQTLFAQDGPGAMHNYLAGFGDRQNSAGENVNRSIIVHKYR